MKSKAKRQGPEYLSTKSISYINFQRVLILSAIKTNVDTTLTYIEHKIMPISLVRVSQYRQLKSKSHPKKERGF